MDNITLEREKIKLEAKKATMWIADFETTTLKNYEFEGCVRVYLWGAKKLDGSEYVTGLTIDDFIKFMQRNDVEHIYFHNLAFDLSFLEIALQNKSYTFSMAKPSRMPVRTYSVLRSNMGAVYSAHVCYKFKSVVHLYDSAKLFPMQVSVLGSAVGVEKLVDDIDHNMFRPKSYIPTAKEMKYLEHDIEIIRLLLIQQFDLYGFFALTRSSYAFRLLQHEWCRDKWGADDIPANWKKQWGKVFPKTSPEEQAYLRPAYAGGIVYVKPGISGVIFREQGHTYDVNSEYPAVMQQKSFPYGASVKFEGKYVKDEKHPLYIQSLRADFTLKDKGIPMLPKKLHMLNRTVYSNHDLTNQVIMLSSVDLEHFFKNYDIKNIEWLGGVKYKATKHPFKSFIDKCAKMKIDADKRGDLVMRLMSKLDMNGSYGKFAQSSMQNRKMSYVSNGVLKFEEWLEEEKAQNYFPMAVFITAYARDTLLNGAYAIGWDNLLYMDTDSIHFTGDVPTGLDVDQHRLGAWSHECTWQEAVFLRDKAYAEKINGELDIKCAGLSAEAKSKIESIEDFTLGKEYEGTFVKKNVKGGILLVNESKFLKPLTVDNGIRKEGNHHEKKIKRVLQLFA